MPGCVERRFAEWGSDNRIDVTLDCQLYRLPHGLIGGFARSRIDAASWQVEHAFVARSTSTLHTRARIRVRGPTRPRSRRLRKLSGRLLGKPFPPRGVTLGYKRLPPHSASIRILRLRISRWRWCSSRGRNFHKLKRS